MSVNVSSRRSSPSIFEMCEGASDDRRREDADTDADADAMHSRLVAYVHALAEGRDSRSGVWMEHSYARARGAAGGGAPDAPDRDVRVLLAARAPSPPGDAVDVDTPEPAPPEPPDAPRDDDRPEGDAADPAGVDDDDDWEARVAALAPTPAHARLADATFEMLRRLRLARLAGRRAVRREDARAAAHRLRLAMAGGWAAPGPAQQRPPAWLHAALHAYLPRELRPLYEEVTAELRRAVPKLAERLFAGRAPPPPPLSPAGEGRDGAADADAGPVLAWLRTGRDRLEERWERRLRRVLHTRPVAVAVGAGAAPPEAWCAAAVGAARAALADAVAAAAAGGREVVAGGVGAGAALCAAALCGAGAARVAGALLLAPALVTAEGGRDAPDDPLGELRAPALLVVGARADNAWRGAARAAARARQPGAPRRLVEVRGADHLLRLGHAARRRLALSQRALDAAVADECARWAAEVADAPDDDDDAAAEWRAGAPPAEEEEYSHLPASTPSHTRAIEIVEGRVVSRVSGGTPLALAPPRRPASASSTPPPALAAADIMQLPIVFADDAGATAGAGRRARAAADAGAVDSVTVTSGEARVERRVKYARVIVAKRGGGVAGGGVAGRGAGGATPSPLPVVVRRGVRVAAAPRD